MSTLSDLSDLSPKSLFILGTEGTSLKEKKLNENQFNKTMTNSGCIPKHAGYKNLNSYQKAEIIYDGTIYFTHLFFNRFDRTDDQMAQAVRSGKYGFRHL